MSLGVNTLTPKNLGNRTIEDLIDNLTLSSLDLSGGTLNVTGTTVIGASSLIPDPLEVNTINERTPGNLRIENTSPGDIIIESSAGEIQLNSTGQININPNGFFNVNAGALASIEADSINIDATATTCFIDAATRLRLREARSIKRSITRSGGGFFNWNSTSVAENTNTIYTDSVMIIGSIFSPGPHAAGLNTNIGNFSYDNNILIPFAGIPFLIINCNQPEIICGPQQGTITNSTFRIEFRNVSAGPIANITFNWIAIGNPSATY